MKRRKTLAIFAAIYYKIAILLILDKGVLHVNLFYFPIHPLVLGLTSSILARISEENLVIGTFIKTERVYMKQKI